jgi:hypothetical protein
LTRPLRQGENWLNVRSLLVGFASGFLAAGFFSSPFVHTHVHSDHEHDGSRQSGAAVHAHLPEAARASASTDEDSVGEDGHGEPLDLFLLVVTKAPRAVALVPSPLVYSAPALRIVGSLRREKVARARDRDPASSSRTSIVLPTIYPWFDRGKTEVEL